MAGRAGRRFLLKPNRPLYRKTNNPITFATTTGLASIGVATSSETHSTVTTTGLAAIGVGSTSYVQPPRRAMEYLTQNIGFADTHVSRNSSYLYQNVSVEVIRESRETSYLYENVSGSGWFGAFPYIVLADQGLSGGNTSDEEVLVGVGAFYGPYSIAPGYRITSVKITAQIRAGVPEVGPVAQWKLEDIGGTVDELEAPVNGGLLSVVHDMLPAETIFDPEASADDEPVVIQPVFEAGVWTDWSQEDALNAGEINTLRSVLATGQVALTVNPGGSGLRQISSVRMVLTLDQDAI